MTFNFKSMKFCFSTFQLAHHFRGPLQRSGAIQNHQRPGGRSNTLSRSIFMSTPKIVDAHLHVWSPSRPFAPGHTPPDSIIHCDLSHFVDQMKESSVEKAVIVQPINYLFDHTYLSECIAQFPQSIAGVMLINGKDHEDQIFSQMTDLHNKGFRGIRLNPALFDGKHLGSKRVERIFGKAGQLGLVVTIMCFDGLKYHVKDIASLVKEYPDTKCCIDHWGFFRSSPASPPSSPDIHPDEESWKALLDLGSYPNVYVKISALFRVSCEGPPHFADLQHRLNILMQAYSSERLVYGSDYPFVLSCGYKTHLDATISLLADFDPKDAENILGKTAQRLFQI